MRHFLSLEISEAGDDASTQPVALTACIFPDSPLDTAYLLGRSVLVCLQHFVVGYSWYFLIYSISGLFDKMHLLKYQFLDQA